MGNFFNGILLLVVLWKIIEWFPEGGATLFVIVMCMGFIAWIADLLKIAPRAFSYFALFNFFSYLFKSKDR